MRPIFRDPGGLGSLLSADGNNRDPGPTGQGFARTGGGSLGRPLRALAGLLAGEQRGDAHYQSHPQPVAPVAVGARERRPTPTAAEPPPRYAPQPQGLAATSAHHATREAAVGLHGPAAAVRTGHIRRSSSAPPPCWPMAGGSRGFPLVQSHWGEAPGRVAPPGWSRNSSKSAKSKPGPTQQLTRVHSPWLRAACHQPAGITCTEARCG